MFSRPALVPLQGAHVEAPQLPCLKAAVWPSARVVLSGLEPEMGRMRTMAIFITEAKLELAVGVLFSALLIAQSGPTSSRFKTSFAIIMRMHDC